MKELYMRKGNTKELKNVIIVAQSSLEKIDSPYKLSKNQVSVSFLNKRIFEITFAF